MLNERKYLCTKITFNKLTFNIEPHIVPYLEVVIDEKLQFTIIVWVVVTKLSCII